MKMELSVSERLTLLNVIPKQGNIVTYRLILALREALSFSEDEITRWMPTICYDLSSGCPRCKGVEWEQPIPFYSVKKCSVCGFMAAAGPPGSTMWRTLDEAGSKISEITSIEFSEAGMDLITDTLNLFNKNDELDDMTAPLYIKFIEQTGASVGDQTPE